MDTQNVKDLVRVVWSHATDTNWGRKARPQIRLILNSDNPQQRDVSQLLSMLGGWRGAFAQRIKTKLREETNPRDTSVEYRFNGAMRELRKQGIVAYRNVMGCCRSCVSGEERFAKLADDQPVIWHYGGQGNKLWLEGDYASEDTLYFNHDNIVNADGSLTEAGQKAVTIFKNFGFKLLGDFSQSKCLELELVSPLVGGKSSGL